MDQALANGMKNQFFRELDFELVAADNRLLEFVKGINQYSDINAWSNFVAQLPNAYGELTLTQCAGGSDDNPYFGLALLDTDKQRPYNSWAEKSLCLFNYLYSFKPPFAKNYNASAYISEHAIKRLYQRSFDLVKFLAKSITHFDVLRELVYVPLWSNFWPQFFFYLNKNKYKVDKLKPVIPTPKGLFLCEHSTANKYHLDIRTFVDTDRLRPDQKLVRDILIKASSQFTSSPVCFRASLVDAGIDYPFLPLQKICMSIVNNTEPISNQISNDKKLNENLRSFLIEFIDRLEDFVFYDEHPLSVKKEDIKRHMIFSER